MQQVAVKFPSVVELIDFVHEGTASLKEVNEENSTLTCDLSQEDLDHVVNNYGASIVE